MDPGTSRGSGPYGRSTFCGTYHGAVFAGAEMWSGNRCSKKLPRDPRVGVSLPGSIFGILLYFVHFDVASARVIVWVKVSFITTLENLSNLDSAPPRSAARCRSPLLTT